MNPEELFRLECVAADWLMTIRRGTPDFGNAHGAIEWDDIRRAVHNEIRRQQCDDVVPAPALRELREPAAERPASSDYPRFRRWEPYGRAVESDFSVQDLSSPSTAVGRVQYFFDEPCT
jgi:hypothetical protein